MSNSFLTALYEENIGQALSILGAYIKDNKHGRFIDRFDKLTEDYRLMVQFMLQGGKDDKRDIIYNKLMKRLYYLYHDVSVEDKKRSNVGLSYYSKYNFEYIDLDMIKYEFERFVQEITLLSLSNETDEERRMLYNEHYEYVTSLFYHIVSSEVWNDNTLDFYVDLITSPTIEQIDASIIVSAIMLSIMYVFDPNKLLALLRIYNRTVNVQVKQRSLVGWALFINEEILLLFDNIRKEIGETLEDANVRSELLELQMQLIHCDGARQDTERIEREIMPELMKGQKLNIDIDKINDNSSIDDIINPNHSEQIIENIEKSYQRMMDMQKGGADIYFGGFSKMKRFPFFSILSNWFVPFTFNHPVIIGFTNEEMRRILEIIIGNGAFCDSDKYSLSLGMGGMLGQIPAQMREVMVNNEMPKAFSNVEEKKSPAYVRRMYLQDLYRFFQLSNFKDYFSGPFIQNLKIYLDLFFASKCFKSVLIKEAIEVGVFLLRRKDYRRLEILLRVFEREEDEGLFPLFGESAYYKKDYFNALSWYQRLYDKETNNVFALQRLAQISFYTDDFEKSEQYYSKLLELRPDNKSYALNLAIINIRLHNLDAGLSILFKLHYENEDDISVIRALSWGQLLRGQAKEALSLLKKIMERGQLGIEDVLNLSYCYWANGEIQSALDEFINYRNMNIDKNKNSIEYWKKLFNNDREVFNIYNILTADQNIMIGEILSDIDS